MQVTFTAAPRPASRPPSPSAHTDTTADASADGETFASLLGAPAEPAPRAKTAGPARDRQAPKSEASRSPRAAGTDAARPPGASSQGEDTTAPTGSAASTAADAGADSSPPSARDAAGSGDENGLRDWLSTLIQWPGSPAAPLSAAELAASRNTPGTEGATDALQADLPTAPAVDTATLPNPWATPAGQALNPTGPGLPAGPGLDAGSARAGGPGTGPRHGWGASAGASAEAGAAASAGAAEAEARSVAHPTQRSKDAGHATARGSDEPLSRPAPTELAPTLASSEAQAEAAALLSGAPMAARSIAAHGAPADPGPPMPLAAAAVNDRGPVPDAPAVAVPLPLPLDDPRFAQALGTQVSLLARDGVHEAALQLNPAEMGPVSVQIVLDGTQARVEFGADMARTREVIERSLPELAAALREAGLTLSGGSVSQHQAGRGESQADREGERARGAAARADRTPAGASEPLAAPARRWVRTGGVDLYA